MGGTKPGGRSAPHPPARRRRRKRDLRLPGGCRRDGSLLQGPREVRNAPGYLRVGDETPKTLLRARISSPQKVSSCDYPTSQKVMGYPFSLRTRPGEIESN